MLHSGYATSLIWLAKGEVDFMPSSETFETMLSKGQDNTLLRYSLANAYVAESRHADAIEHLKKALEFDPQYSAAFKLLGACYMETSQHNEAVDIYEQGIEVAQDNGDKQAAKEMGVFLKRANKAIDKT